MASSLYNMLPVSWQAHLSEILQPIPLWDVTLGFALVIAACGLFDLLVCRHDDDRGRWFEVHAFGNLLVVIMSLPAMWVWITSPLDSQDSDLYPIPDMRHVSTWYVPNNQWIAFLVPGVHLYHCLFFKLSAQDIFHHFAFVPFIAGSGLVFRWGPLRNVLAFFISGLPGGIDYLMLALMKRGKLGRLTEKRYNASINTWIRTPGLVLFSGTMYITWAHDRAPHTNTYISFLMMLFVLYNGLYYGEMAVANYASTKTRTDMFIAENINTEYGGPDCAPEPENKGRGKKKD